MLFNSLTVFLGNVRNSSFIFNLLVSCRRLTGSTTPVN